MPEGHVTHAQKDGIHVLRYSGTVTFMLAPAIQTFIEGLMDRHLVSGFVFDLTAADSLDSTNLGLMARINERLHDGGAGNSVILWSNEDIEVVLRSMGFDRTFELVHHETESERPPGSAVHVEAPSEDELRRTMLEAHRALMRLSDAGRIQFEPVVACLEQAATSSATPHIETR